MADELHITREGGKIVDTIPTYVWRRLIGGQPYNGGEIPKPSLGKMTVVFGEGDKAQTYVRKSRVMSGFRLVAFVADDLPRTTYWPTEAMRQIAQRHPDLVQIRKREAQGSD